MNSDTPEKVPPPRPTPPSTLPMNPEAASQEEEFVKAYHDAYKHVDRGITLVTQNLHTQAGADLQKGLNLLDKALSIKIENFDCSGEKIQHYAEMQNKMRCTRKEVLLHFADTQITSNPSSVTQGIEDAPPSYDDYLKSLDSGASSSGGQASSLGASASTASSSSPAYPRLSALNPQVQEAAFSEIASDSPIATPVMSPQNGEMIFQIENGVQIFFIYSDGRVTSPSYPSFLAVFTFPENIGHNTGPNAARGFLQVGEWSYPLIPARSPVLHSFYGAYMFPDVTNSVPGSSVGIIIPDTVDKETLEFFEQILMQLTSFHEQKVPEGVDAEKETQLIQESTSERIASGAEAISKGVVWGASKLSELITIGSENLKGYVQPEDSKKEIDPKWQKTAKVARDVSGKAVKVSGFLLSQVGKATMALGRKVAPHIQRHGTRAISHLTGQKDEEASSNVEGVMEVAAGAVRGASTVYMGLETAAATLARSLTDNTVKVVTHKYGEEVGSLTDNALYAVGQTAMAGHNIASLGVKGIAKRTAKDTGKALVHQHEEKKQAKKQNQVEEAEEAEEAMEVTEEDEEEPPTKPVREKKKKPL